MRRHVITFAVTAAFFTMLGAACDGESDSTDAEDVFDDAPDAEESRLVSDSCFDWCPMYQDCATFGGYEIYSGGLSEYEVCYPHTCTTNSQCPSQMTCVSTNPPVVAGECQAKCTGVRDCYGRQTCRIRGFTSWKTCGWD